MAAEVHKTYNINLVINIKRGKDELEFAKAEADRFHTYISDGKELAWAKEQIQKLHSMIFMPSADQIKNELVERLKKEDDTTPDEAGA